MSLLSSRAGMKHRCSVQRDAGADTPNAWNNPGTPDWQDHLTDLPCRAWTNVAREPIEAQKTFVAEDRRVAVELGTDVTEADQLGDITDPAGTVIFPGPMNIQGVLAYPDHLELIVEQIR